MYFYTKTELNKMEKKNRINQIFLNSLLIHLHCSSDKNIYPKYIVNTWTVTKCKWCQKRTGVNFL